MIHRVGTTAEDQQRAILWAARFECDGTLMESGGHAERRQVRVRLVAIGGRQCPEPRGPDGSPRSQGNGHAPDIGRDRKSTRLNSSHSSISYAVFCLKKKISIDRAHVLRIKTNKEKS